jgi:hypothetical protein
MAINLPSATSSEAVDLSGTADVLIAAREAGTSVSQRLLWDTAARRQAPDARLTQGRPAARTLPEPRPSLEVSRILAMRTPSRTRHPAA